jgi:hypothetical protein
MECCVMFGALLPEITIGSGTNNHFGLRSVSGRSASRAWMSDPIPALRFTLSKVEQESPTNIVLCRLANAEGKVLQFTTAASAASPPIVPDSISPPAGIELMPHCALALRCSQRPRACSGDNLMIGQNTIPQRGNQAKQ